MEGFLGIGGNELILILLFAFLIFGPDKLPEIARTIGRAIAKFRDAQNEVNEVIRTEVYDPLKDEAKNDTPVQKAAEKAAALNKPEPPKTETFAERKARYDKIRAERKAKEDAAKAAAEAKAAGQDGAGSTPAASEPPHEPTNDELDALMGVSKPKPASTAAATAPASAETPSVESPTANAEGGEA